MTSEDDFSRFLESLGVESRARELRRLVDLAKQQGWFKEADPVLRQVEGTLRNIEYEANEGGRITQEVRREEERESRGAGKTTEKIVTIARAEAQSLDSLWRDFAQLEQELTTMVGLDAGLLKRNYVTQSLLAAGSDPLKLKQSIAGEANAVKMVQDREAKAERALRIADGLVQQYVSKEKEFERLPGAGTFSPDQVEKVRTSLATVSRWLNYLKNEMTNVRNELATIRTGLTRELHSLGEELKALDDAQKRGRSGDAARAFKVISDREIQLQKFFEEIAAAEKVLTEKVREYRQGAQQAFQTLQAATGRLTQEKAA